MEIRTLADIERIERRGLGHYLTARCTNELILQGATENPQKPAIHFIRSGASYSDTVTFLLPASRRSGCRARSSVRKRRDDK